MSPPVIRLPSRKALDGVNSQSLLSFSGGTSTPRGMKTSPVFDPMVSRGRWMPSKISPMMPGPRPTLRGFRVRSTGSPTQRPLVSS